jgi:hypothetical protein
LGPLLLLGVTLGRCRHHTECVGKCDRIKAMFVVVALDSLKSKKMAFQDVFRRNELGKC